MAGREVSRVVGLLASFGLDSFDGSLDALFNRQIQLALFFIQCALLAHYLSLRLLGVC